MNPVPRAVGQDSSCLPPVETIVIVRDFAPGQALRLVFLSADDAAALPALPAAALALVVFPGGYA